MADKLLLTHQEQRDMLPAFDDVLLFSLERRYLEVPTIEALELSDDDSSNGYSIESDLRILKINEVSYLEDDDDGLHLLNMQNVLASMKDDLHNVISIICGTKDKTSIYYGLSNRETNNSKANTDEYSKVLQQTLHGNFLGAKTTQLSTEEIEREIIPHFDERHYEITALSGILSLRLKDPQGPYVQGIDRFIEGMRGEEYTLVVIAEPISLPTIDGIIKNLFDLGSGIHSDVKATVQKTKGSSDTFNVGMFGMRGNNLANTISDAVTKGTTKSDTTGGAHTIGESRIGAGALLPAAGSAAGAAIGGGVGGAKLGALFGSIIPGIGTAVGAIVGGALGGLVGTAGAFLSGLATAKTDSSTESWSHTTSTTESFTHSVANTMGSMTGLGGQGGYARAWNRSRSVSQEVLNKTAEYCEKLCDAYIERLQAGKNLGMWNVGVYLLTPKETPYTRIRAQGLLRATFAGDTTYWEPMRALKLNEDVIGKYLINFTNPEYNLFRYGSQSEAVKEAASFIHKIKAYVSRCGHPIEKIFSMLSKNDVNVAQMLEEIRNCPGKCSDEELKIAWDEIKKRELGHPFGDIMGGVSTPLNTEELSIIMNVPRQEVQGITIREAAPFGVNYVLTYNKSDIRIGRVVHKREPLDELPYVVPRELFKKHAFVCGVTGSGKTNTCMSLLKNIDLPFLVIEPAKTEYRQMMNLIPDLRVYTLGRETIAPFRINPFEFEPGSELLTHIDSIEAVFNAAFPMYASMPYILEEAIVEIYRDKGWDLASSTNRYIEDMFGDERYDYLPTLQDLYNKIPVIVEQKQYAQEQTMNIQAALMARLSSLLTGSKGLMLNTRRSTPMKELLESKVVLELKNIGDDDEKCFLMGVLLSAVYQYREQNGGIGSKLSHVLLIEEAHRLLRHTPDFVSPEIGNSRGKAVETFTNVISEIREYGQGVIIVDQIPSKLTPDVVKNTNIKIIHRTLAKDDREYVGSTMNLTEEQDRELCLLEVGRAVIHREGMDKAFLVQIDPIKEGLEHITDEKIRAAMQGHVRHISDVYGVDKVDGLAAVYAKEDLRRRSPNLLACSAAALLLLAAEDDADLRDIKKIFADELRRDLGIDGELRAAAHAIDSAGILFERLNDRYHGNYKASLLTQRLFVDAWLGKDIDKEELRTNLKKMTNVEDSEPAYAGVLAWYVRVDSFSPSNVEEIVRITHSETPDHKHLDRLLRVALGKTMRGIALSHRNEPIFLTILYRELLAKRTGLIMESKVREYADHLAGKGA